jgi:glycerophosphoryl diester phosphodiesterase
LSGHPLIFGHRGAAGLAPENSLPAFERAVALGADGVECDVHLSADSVPVVIHDAAVGRTTDGRGTVESLSSNDLARLALRRGGGPLPTLDAVARLLAPTGLLLNVEIKTAQRGRRYDGIEAAVVRSLGRAGMTERTIVSSFAWDCVADVLALARPRGALGLLDRRGVAGAGGATRALARARALGFDGLCLPAEYLRGLRLGPADRAAVWVYRADTRAGLRRALTAGVGAVITDRPDLALLLREGDPPA